MNDDTLALFLIMIPALAFGLSGVVILVAMFVQAKMIQKEYWDGGEMISYWKGFSKAYERFCESE